MGHEFLFQLDLKTHNRINFYFQKITTSTKIKSDFLIIQESPIEKEMFLVCLYVLMF